MNTLGTFSTEELKKEIERRVFIEQRPKILENPDIKKLRNAVEQYVDFVASEEYCEDNDFDHYIFEDVMTAFYGEDFWAWHNNQNRE